jgi:hypothetical protein
MQGFGMKRLALLERLVRSDPNDESYGGSQPSGAVHSQSPMTALAALPKSSAENLLVPANDS